MPKAKAKERTPEGAQSKIQPNSTLKKLLLSILSEGTRENPVRRNELTRKTGLSDRAVRGTINDMRNAGFPICSSATSSGYWMAEDRWDMRRFLKEYTHYAAEIYRCAAAMEAVWEKAETKDLYERMKEEYSVDQSNV